MGERPGDATAASDVGFGGLLRAYRVRGLLSQERLAERSGLSARTIRDLEAGRVRHPRGASVRLLADALGLAGWQRGQFEQTACLWLAAGQPAAPPAASSPSAVTPRQLPPVVADFVGRAEQVSQLRQLLVGRPDGADGEPETAAVVVSAVAGKAGVGKSALAVHVAHQLAAAFPDGQLYASLRGGGVTGMSPLDPAEVLGRFLRALGVDGGAIPSGVEERVALYRSRLAGRRVLVVLDDAADQTQIRPLLPGHPGAAVLVTSRARLAGLEGARLIHLDVLDAGQAVELLARIAGPGRVAAEPEAAAAIVAACGGLPLAVRIAGARLAARPHWPLGRMAGLLADERGRLDELAYGDLEVRASLSLSYQGLSQQQRRLFRRLGVLAAPDVAGWVAAALLDRPLPEAEALLEELVDAQLADVAGRDVTGRPRYRLHDLLHVYARERVHADETLGEWQAALERALGGWLALAEQADQQLPTSALGSAHGQAARWQPHESVRERLLPDPVAWFEAERAALVAAVSQAAELGWDELAWDLAGSLSGFLWLRDHFDDWQHVLEVALAATRRAGNLYGQAHMLHRLGELHGERDRLDDGIACLDEALLLRRRLGDRHGEAYSLNDRGTLIRFGGSLDDAVACYESALSIFEEVGDRRGQACAMLGLGGLRRDQGRHADALARHESALVLFRQVSDRRREGMTLRGLGRLHQARGQPDEAAAYLKQGLALFRKVGDRLGEAYTLQSLGDLHVAQGNTRQASGMLQACLAVFAEVGERYGQAVTLLALGRLFQAQGRLEQATACLARSLDLCRQIRIPLWEARAQSSLAAVYASRGEAAAARGAWREALELFEKLGTPEAEQLAAQLQQNPIS